MTTAEQPSSRAGQRSARGSRIRGRATALLASAALAVMAHGNPAHASTGPMAPGPPLRPAAQPPGSELRVYLMTMGPGAEVWERFGHNAIWILDEARGTSRAYNYGLFDFGQEGFILRFVQGRMWYRMDDFPALPYAERYVRDDRSVWVQELNLSPAQRSALRDFLEWNDQDANRYYAYDYYRDNCSTRIRDALDRVLGGQIRRQTAALPAGTTFRWHTRRLTAGDLPLYTALDLALGQPVDQPISAWKEMFLPLELREHLRKVTVRGSDGHEVPLVKSESALYLSKRYGDPAAPPKYWLGYLIAGTGFGVGLLALGLRARWSPSAGRAFIWLGTLALLLAGVGGLILTGLWAWTDHTAAYRNENLFQLNLLALPLAALLPTLRSTRRFAHAARWLALAVAAIALLGVIVKLLPAFDQDNAELLAFFVPAHLGLAAGMWWLTLAPAPPSLKAKAASPRRR